MNDLNAMNTPAELRGIEAALDRLALADRESGGAGLEGRLHAATCGALGRRDQIEPKAVVATIRPATFRLFSRLQVAAGLALAGAVGAVWLAGLRVPATQSGGAVAEAPAELRYEALDAQVESVLAWNNPMGEGFEGLSEQIDLLYADLWQMDSGDDDASSLWMDGSAL